MCLPLAVVGAGMAAAGALTGGMTALAQGNYQSDVAKQNAATEIQAAHDSVTRGQDEAAQFYKQVGRTKGEDVAAMAANGIDVGYGSGERVQEDTQAGADADANRLYYNIDQRTKGNYVNANNFVTEAKAARMRGQSAMIQSVFQAGSSLMSGFSQQAKLRAAQGGGGSSGPMGL